MNMLIIDCFIFCFNYSYIHCSTKFSSMDMNMINCFKPYNQEANNFIASFVIYRLFANARDYYIECFYHNSDYYMDNICQNFTNSIRFNSIQENHLIYSQHDEVSFSFKSNSSYHSKTLLLTYPNVQNITATLDYQLIKRLLEKTFIQVIDHNTSLTYYYQLLNYQKQIAIITPIILMEGYLLDVSMSYSYNYKQDTLNT